jgi:hypothetical protein
VIIHTEHLLVGLAVLLIGFIGGASVERGINIHKQEVSSNWLWDGIPVTTKGKQICDTKTESHPNGGYRLFVFSNNENDLDKLATAFNLCDGIDKHFPYIPFNNEGRLPHEVISNGMPKLINPPSVIGEPIPVPPFNLPQKG